MLTSAQILKEIQNGRIKIEPFDEESLMSNPNSYDIHLGNKLLTYSSEVLDMKKENSVIEEIIPEEGYTLLPGVLYLGSTLESTSTPYHIPKLDGVSSVARLGISIHETAGFGDIGFEGKWTLEITVTHPVIVYPGARIGQVYFESPEGEIVTRYHGKYQNSEDVMASKSFKDFK